MGDLTGTAVAGFSGKAIKMKHGGPAGIGDVPFGEM
jgi:hypothetical protein